MQASIKRMSLSPSKEAQQIRNSSKTHWGFSQSCKYLAKMYKWYHSLSWSTAVLLVPLGAPGASSKNYFARSIGSPFFFFSKFWLNPAEDGGPGRSPHDQRSEAVA